MSQLPPLRRRFIVDEYRRPGPRISAGDLPSNRALPNDVTPESLMPGWTVQQPYAHAVCAVALTCVYCGQRPDQHNWTRHTCKVRDILGELRGPA